MKCDKCGTEVNEKDKFCPNCGSKIIVETGIENQKKHKRIWDYIPGFRTGKTWKKIVAVIGYLCMAVLFWAILSGSDNKIGDFLSLASVTIFPFVILTNMSGIRDKLPLFRKHKLVMNILGVMATVFVSLVLFTITIGLFMDTTSREVDNANLADYEQEALKKNLYEKESLTPKLTKEAEPTETPTPEPTATPTPEPTATPVPEPESTDNISTDTREQINEFLSTYLNTDDKKRKKIKKKLKKEEANSLKEVIFDYAAEYYMNKSIVTELSKLYQEIFPDDDYSKVWRAVENAYTRKDYDERQLKEADNNSSNVQANTGYFNISNRLGTKYEDNIMGSISKFSDYISPDNTYVYAAFDQSGQECVVLSDKAFEHSGNQEIAYYTNGEKRTVYTEDGFEREVPVYVRVDMDIINQRNEAVINEEALKQEIYRIECEIRYRLEGKTTADIYQGDYVFPASDKRVLDVDDVGLAETTNSVIQTGINEIYARHGRIFRDAEWNEYFSGKEWYHGTIKPDDFTDDMLSEIEKENVNFLSTRLENFSFKETISSEDVDTEEQENLGTDYYEETDGTICYVINCNESITLRVEPDVSAEEICQIPLGTAVEAIQGAPNGFIQVVYQGMVGYCLGDYLSGM